MPELAIAVLGPDRPGVVAAVSEALLGGAAAAGGGNLTDASMTVLRGQFAMTLVVDVALDEEQAARLLAPVAAALGLRVSVRAADPDPDLLRPPSAPYVLRLHGADRPGLVHRATALLAGYDANITDLTTRLVAGDVYVMLVSVDVPTSAPVDGLVHAVAELAAELQVEASLRPADSDVL